MLTVQHALVTLYAFKGDVEKVKKYFHYIALPDAIRMYTGNRQYSHFEINSLGNDVSWLKFPKDLKHLGKDTEFEKYLASDIKPCCIGEETQISIFDKVNSKLSLDYRYCVRMHLVQDYIYDNFIREVIDCKDKYNGIFICNGKQYDSTTVRGLITAIEDDGIAYLSKYIKDTFNISVNQAWFDENIKPIFYNAYSKELADNTYKYVKVRDDINQALRTGNFKEVKLTKLSSYADYMEMYSLVASECNKMLNIIESRTYTCKERIRNGNTIVCYILQNNLDSSIIKVSPDILKKQLINGLLLCSNLTLTSDGRLVLKEG